MIQQTPNRYRVLAAVMLCGIMGPIDASIVNVILPTIGASFGAPMAAAQWVPMVYLLTISSLLLFFGRLGDMVGYRRVYLAGLAGFAAASALCGFAPSLELLVAFRAIQGVAAGMMMSVPFAILAAVFPPAERGRALGIHAVSISAGLALGPSLGGLITAVAGWRYAFLINVPVGIVGLLWGSRAIPDTRGQAGRLDFPGAATAFAALFSLLFFANRAPTAGLNASTGAALATGALASAAFLWVESRSAAPMLKLQLFRPASFSLGSASALLNFMSQYVLVFLTPFYLQRVVHLPPNEVGLTMTALPLMVMLMAPLSGTLSDKLGTRALAAAGATITSAALVLMSLLPDGAGVTDVAWRLALFGIGTGLFQSPNNSSIMASAPRAHLGSASGVLATMRNVGMVMGIALGGAILYAAVPQSVLGQVDLGGAQAAAFLGGLRLAFAAGAVVALLAAAGSWLAGRSAPQDGSGAPSASTPARTL